MNVSIIDQRRKEGWNIVLWATPRAVIIQVTPPENGIESSDNAPVDARCGSWEEAVRFAETVCDLSPGVIWEMFDAGKEADVYDVT